MSFCSQPVLSFGGCFGLDEGTRTIGLALAGVQAALGLLTGLILLRLLGGRRASTSFEVLLPLLGVSGLLAAALDAGAATNPTPANFGLFQRFAGTFDILSLAALLIYAVLVFRRLADACARAIAGIATSLFAFATVAALILSSVCLSTIEFVQRRGALEAGFATRNVQNQFFEEAEAIVIIYLGIIGSLILFCIGIAIREPSEVLDLTLLAVALSLFAVEGGLSLDVSNDSTVTVRRFLATAGFAGLCLGALLRNRRSPEYFDIEKEQGEKQPRRVSRAPARLSSINVTPPKMSVSSIWRRAETQQPGDYFSTRSGYGATETDTTRRRDGSWSTLSSVLPEVLVANFPRPPTQSEFPRGPSPPDSDSDSDDGPRDGRESSLSAITDGSNYVIQQASLAKRSPSTRVPMRSYVSLGATSVATSKLGARSSANETVSPESSDRTPIAGSVFEENITTEPNQPPHPASPLNRTSFFAPDPSDPYGGLEPPPPAAAQGGRAPITAVAAQRARPPLKRGPPPPLQMSSDTDVRPFKVPLPNGAAGRVGSAR